MIRGLTLFFGFFIALTSYAYIPPPQFILDRMQKSRDGLKSLELIAEVKDLQKSVIFNETLRLDFSGGRYWSVATETAGALASSKFGKLVDLKGLSQAWIEIGLDPSEYRFREALQQHEVWPTDKTETRLIREGGAILWSWGELSQIRIEKDKFVWSGFVDDKKNELLVKEQARFPRVIIVKVKGQDRFQYTLKQYKINAPVKWNTQNPVPPQGNFVEPVRDWIELVR